MKLFALALALLPALAAGALIQANPSTDDVNNGRVRTGHGRTYRWDLYPSPRKGDDQDDDQDDDRKGGRGDGDKDHKHDQNDRRHIYAHVSANMQKRQQSALAFPKLAQNFALVMVDDANPNLTRDYYGTTGRFFYFTMRSGTLMAVDDGSDMDASQNLYFSFTGTYDGAPPSGGLSTWLETPSSADNWTMDQNTGMIARNGQKTFALCTDSTYPNGMGVLGVSSQVCADAYGMQFVRVKFRAVNRKEMLPATSNVGAYPQY